MKLVHWAVDGWAITFGTARRGLGESCWHQTLPWSSAEESDAASDIAGNTSVFSSPAPSARNTEFYLSRSVAAKKSGPNPVAYRIRGLMDDNELDVRPSRLVTVGDRSFGSVGPKLWNSLPDDITSASSLSVFRKKLKTHLFQQSYSDIIL